jgi:hypothetical protein
VTGIGCIEPRRLLVAICTVVWHRSLGIRVVAESMLPSVPLLFSHFVLPAHTVTLNETSSTSDQTGFVVENTRLVVCAVALFVCMIAKFVLKTNI